ncbi:MAG: 4-(cytidine 5'-diphospho)-2-C-methyl-D-erythritol kinase, partial [Planctomycetales bacterium]|nr:4-(cytidine 5'-diphospho)-2-C-methyl-D-erythritol kinase [Planctomycetales bacterium]
HLEILARRADGYHEVETVMTTVNLFDTLRLIPCQDRSISMHADWAQGRRAVAECRLGSSDALGDVPRDDRNLVVRALELLRATAEETTSRTLGGARVTLIKRIPSAAGLGGASSDAAAALLAGNLGWGLNWPKERLAELAAALGSDVAFFLYGRTAFCRGRGEQVSPWASANRHFAVIVRPPISLSTAEVYRHCQVPSKPQKVEQEHIWQQGTSAEVGSRLFNRLQTAAELLTPWCRQIARAFEDEQVYGHQLSGSGSCYFGICRNREHARRVAQRLGHRGPQLAFPVETNCPVRIRRNQVHCLS